jgi:hypothetical protein
VSLQDRCTGYGVTSRERGTRFPQGAQHQVRAGGITEQKLVGCEPAKKLGSLASYSMNP